MTDIPINDVTRRVQFTGNTTTGPFNFTFEILTAADVEVYKNNTKQTLTTHYTVTINSNGTGFVTMGSALVSSDVLTIIGGRAISRTTDFVTAGDLLASSLNEQLDSLVIMNQQLSEKIDRTIKANPGDTRISSLTLPLAASRASKLVSFDADGDLLVDSGTNLNLVLGTVTIGTILGTNDIDLKPAGGQVNILGTSGQQRIQFNNDATPEMLFYQNSNTTTFGVTNPTGSRTINLPDASGTVALTNQNTLSPTGDFTVDASGDVVLDADGGEVLFKDAGTTSFTFRVSGAGSRILTSSNLTIETGGSGDIDLKPVGGQVNILGTGGEQRILFNNDATPTIKYYQNSNTLDLAVDTLDGSRTITLPNATDTLVGKATTDTLTNKTLTSAVLNTGVSGTAIKDEDNMSSNSATHLATQQSIKAYVDSSIAGSPTGDITSVVAGTGLTGGGTSGDVTVNVIGGTGITANADDIAIDSTVTTLTGTQTLTNKTLTTPIITSISNSGTVTIPTGAETLVGRATTDTLTNKTLTSPVLNTGVSGTAIKDEDDLSSNSATHLATQQSIKAYVDAQVAGGGAGNLSTVLGIGNTTGGNNIRITGGDSIIGLTNINLDAAGYIIFDTDDGNIYLNDDGAGFGQISGANQNLTFKSSTSDKDIIFQGNDGGSSITALTLDMSNAGAASFNSSVDAGAGLRLSTDGSNNAIITALGQDKDIYFSGDDGGSGVNALVLDMSAAGAATFNAGATFNGDLDVTTATDARLTINDSIGEVGSGNLAFQSQNSSGSSLKPMGFRAEDIRFATGSAERMRIDSSGNVGIGLTNPSDYYAKELVVSAADEGGITLVSSTTHNAYLAFADGTSGNARYRGQIFYDHNQDKMGFATAGSTIVSLDSSGRVGIGVAPADMNDSGGVASLQAGGTFLVHFDPDGSGTTSLRNNVYADGGANKALFYGYTSDYYQTSGTHVWRNSGVTSAGATASMTERMRIDSSGKILISKTTDSIATAGTAISDALGVRAAVTDNIAALFNRLPSSTSNGNIVQFRYNSNAIGNIAVNGDNNLQIFSDSSDHSGLEFATHLIAPLEAGSSSDGTIDMGATSARFHTGYFSNGTSSSSDQNEKQNIAELTATELAVSKRLAKTFRTFRRIDAVEAKGDNARTHTGTIAQEVHAAFAAEGLDAAKYGMYMSDTWKDNDDKEITRLGIRYEQLLSFISAGAEQRLTDIETRLAALEG